MKTRGSINISIKSRTNSLRRSGNLFRSLRGNKSVDCSLSTDDSTLSDKPECVALDRREILRNDVRASLRRESCLDDKVSSGGEDSSSHAARDGYMRTIEEMEMELSTWKECYELAVQSSQHDANERVKFEFREKEEAILQEKEMLQKKLADATKYVDDLEKSAAAKRLAYERQLADLRDVNEEHEREKERLTEELENARERVLAAKEKSERSGNINSAETVMNLVAERDSALAECEAFALRVLELEAEIKVLEHQREQYLAKLKEAEETEKERRKNQRRMQVTLEQYQEDTDKMKAELEECIVERAAAEEEVDLLRWKLKDYEASIRMKKSGYEDRPVQKVTGKKGFWCL